MKGLLGSIYRKTIAWSGHRRAPAMLAAVGYTEAIFFPVMPDLLLVPMTLARPHRWFYLASLCTAASVAGGITAWALGYYSYELLEPLIIQLIPHWPENLERIQHWLVRWGPWVIMIAGFSPVPYKAFTIAAGLLSMSLPVFIVASLLGRGARFFLVAAVMRYIGPRAMPLIKRNVALLGWLSVVVFLLLLWILQ